jgi:hypothetical protein
MNLQQALQFLASGGSIVVVAAFLSWSADNWPAFRALSTAIKQTVMVVACLVLALGAWTIQAYVSPAVLVSLAAPFGIAITTVSALLGNQAWHALINKANPTISSLASLTPPARAATADDLRNLVDVANTPAQTVAMPLVR